MSKNRKDHHTKRERIIAKYIAENVKGSYVLMNPMSPVNALVTDGNHVVRRFLEIKTRNELFADQGTVWLTAKTYYALKQVSDQMKSPVWLVIAYNDCVIMIDADNIRKSYTDARDDIRLPVEKFSRLPLPQEYPRD